MRKILNDIYKYIGGLRIFRKKHQFSAGFKMQELTKEKLQLAIYLTSKTIERNKRDREFLDAMFPNKKNAGIFSKTDPQISANPGEPIMPPSLLKIQEDSKHTMQAILHNNNLNKDHGKTN